MTGAARRGAALAAALAAAVACAAPAVVVRPGSGSAATEFRVRADAPSVVLTGTMTGWRPVPLVRRDGAFELALRLPPGRYEYRLEVREDGAIHPVWPEGVERADDGFGGENAVLRIPGP